MWDRCVLSDTHQCSEGRELGAHLVWPPHVPRGVPEADPNHEG